MKRLPRAAAAAAAIRLDPSLPPAAAPAPAARPAVIPLRRRPDPALFARPTVALVGNPKVGKSTLFARLSRRPIADVPLPGTSLAVRVRALDGAAQDLVDAPAAYSLFGPGDDERAVAGLLLGLALGHEENGIVVVADGKNLKRSLALALQCAELGLPMLLAVNMTDEATAHGIRIDHARLAGALDLEVRPVVASAGTGLPELRGGLAALRVPRRLVRYSPPVEELLEVAAKLLNAHQVPGRAAALLLLAGEPAAEELIRATCGAAMLAQLRQLAAPLQQPDPTEIASHLTAAASHTAERLVREVQTTEATGPSRGERLANLCTRPLTGVPIALAVAATMYLAVGRFAAGFIVDHLKGALLDGRALPWLDAHLRPLLPGTLLGDVLLDRQLGLVQTGLFLPLGLVLPPLFCFYVFFGFLEDSGYLPRLSFLLNRALHVVGLNGKGVLPLALGFSCVTMATLATRTLDSARERTIASFLLLLGVPCSPLLAVMLIVLGPLPASAAATVFGLLLVQILAAGVLLSRLLPGRPTPLLLELVPLRLPRPGQVLRRAAARTGVFLKEALPLFLLAGLVVFVFARIGGLRLLERAARPIMSGLLELPAESVQVFLKALIRRESGAAELVHLRHSFSGLQLVVITFLMTFSVPCINTVLVLVRERGARTTAIIVAAVLGYALVAGALLARVGRLVGLTFS
jgi:ferrous iron transport protein B